MNKKQRNNWKIYADRKYRYLVYKNDLDKVCFQHDMAYGKSKDLLKRAQPDNFLRDKAFKIATDPSFLIKRVLVEQLNKSQILNLQVNFIDRKLENLRDEKFINLLETIFGVLI